MVTFRMAFLMNNFTNIVMDDGWVHLLAKTLPSLIGNLWWNIIMDDYLDGTELHKLSSLHHCKSITPSPQKKLKIKNTRNDK